MTARLLAVLAESPAPPRGTVEHVNTTLRRTLAVAVLTLAPVLSSCGFDNPTDQVYNPGVGVNDRSGSVDVLNALIVSGAPGSGTLVATLNNSDDEDDSLTEVAGSGDDSSLTIDLGTAIEIPSGGSVSLTDEGEISVEGEGLEQGQFVALTFTFERGESVEMQVPVVARRGAYSDIPVPSVAPSSAAPEEEEESSP